MASWLQVQTRVCLDILCRAYYGLPLRPSTYKDKHEKAGYTGSLTCSIRKGWIDQEDRLTKEGEMVLRKSLKYWSKKDVHSNQST